MEDATLVLCMKKYSKIIYFNNIYFFLSQYYDSMRELQYLNQT